MKTQSIQVRGREMRLLTCHTAVVGSGAAGYAAANRLYEAGQRDIVMLTEGVNKGTSRNTGSDKQTYYKLSLCGGTADSWRPPETCAGSARFSAHSLLFIRSLG